MLCRDHFAGPSTSSGGYSAPGPSGITADQLAVNFPALPNMQSSPSIMDSSVDDVSFMYKIICDEEVVASAWVNPNFQ